MIFAGGGTPVADPDGLVRAAGGLVGIVEHVLQLVEHALQLFLEGAAARSTSSAMRARSAARPEAPARDRAADPIDSGSRAVVPGALPVVADSSPVRGRRLSRIRERTSSSSRCSPASSENRRNSGSKPGILTATLYSPRSQIEDLEAAVVTSDHAC